jgi:hypothetical protein
MLADANRQMKAMALLGIKSKHPEYGNRVFIVGKRELAANHIDGRRGSWFRRALLDSIGIPDDSPASAPRYSNPQGDLKSGRS